MLSILFRNCGMLSILFSLVVESVCYLKVRSWRSVNGNALVSIKVVAAHQARLILGWVTCSV